MDIAVIEGTVGRERLYWCVKEQTVPCIKVIKTMMMMIIIIIIINIQKSVTTIHERKVTALWNQKFRTNRTTPNNKPDITINKEHACQ